MVVGMRFGGATITADVNKLDGTGQNKRRPDDEVGVHHF